MNKVSKKLKLFLGVLALGTFVSSVKADFFNVERHWDLQDYGSLLATPLPSSLEGKQDLLVKLSEARIGLENLAKLYTDKECKPDFDYRIKEIKVREEKLSAAIKKQKKSLKEIAKSTGRTVVNSSAVTGRTIGGAGRFVGSSVSRVATFTGKSVRGVAQIFKRTSSVEPKSSNVEGDNQDEVVIQQEPVDVIVVQSEDDKEKDALVASDSDIASPGRFRRVAKKVWENKGKIVVVTTPVVLAAAGLVADQTLNDGKGLEAVVDGTQKCGSFVLNNSPLKKRNKEEK